MALNLSPRPVSVTTPTMMPAAAQVAATASTPIGPQPEGGDDPLDQAADLGLVEHDVGGLDAAVALHPDRAGAVDEDVGDGVVAEQPVEHAEALHPGLHPADGGVGQGLPGGVDGVVRGAGLHGVDGVDDLLTVGLAPLQERVDGGGVGDVGEGGPRRPPDGLAVHRHRALDGGHVHGRGVEQRRQRARQDPLGIDLDLRQAGQEAQGDADHDHAERGRHRDALGYRRDRHDGDDRGHRDDDQLHVISFSG